MPLLENESIKLYALAATVVALHLVLLASWTGAVRTRIKKWINPEDVAVLKGAQVEVDHVDVARVKRAHLNALENAVPFFVIGYLYALTGPSKLGLEAYFGTFVAARVLHSLFYLFGKQPFRTASFGVGVAALVGMGIHVLRVAA